MNDPTYDQERAQLKPAPDSLVLSALIDSATEIVKHDHIGGTIHQEAADFLVKMYTRATE